MKKFIFLIATMCVACSCATVCIGDVTAYNADGSVLEKWGDVVISSNNAYLETSVFKAFGINFYDTKSEKFIVVGNAVPCIIEYDVHENKSSKKPKKEKGLDKLYSKYSKQQLIDEYRALGEYVSNAREKLSTLDKNSSEFEILKEDIKQARIKQKLIYFICSNKYGIELIQQ